MYTVIVWRVRSSRNECAELLRGELKIRELSVLRESARTGRHFSYSQPLGGGVKFL